VTILALELDGSGRLRLVVPDRRRRQRFRRMFNSITLLAHNPGPTTGRGNNTYLLVGGHGQAALIDAGVGEPRHLTAVVDSLEARGARLALVLVTHAHHDHVAGALALDSAHEGVRFHKYPWPGEDEKYPVVWHALREGEKMDVGGEPLEVLRTPGHSPDHVSFWHRPSGTLFAGDLVVPGSSVMIPWSRGGHLRQYLDSLRLVLALKPRRLLPAHGDEVTEPAALLSSYLSHRAGRERQIVAALADGQETVQAIAESIYDGLEPALIPAARENVRAHLEMLREEGRAVETDGRWQLRHSRDFR
jgi:glyoxylase-like metal-dependent hydrolase (beta-lactamase superfamily II)